MELHSEGKPLVETLVDFFEEVEYRNFERRVFLLLDAVMRGQEISMSESNAESTEGTEAQSNTETVEGDQVVVNEASPGTEATESEAPAESDPSHDGSGDGESESTDSE